MPAASAQKRARQRANKLSQVGSTTTTTQTPEIVPLPAQPSDSIPSPQASAPPSPISIDFKTFIDICNLEDVLRFLDTVATTREGKNLKLLWDRAFKAGLDQGRNEERDLRDEMYRRGKEVGIKQAEKPAKRADFERYSHGIEQGRIMERSEWTSKGHGLQCFSPVAILSNQSIQTDPEPPTTSIATQTSNISYLETSVQVSEPPPSLSQPQKVISKPLDWAEDTYSLPITPLPAPALCQPRDLSVLRSSSSSSPFSSLHYRSNRFNHYPRRSHRCHSHFNNSFYSPHHDLPKPSQPHFYTKTYSHLNWESDPRLSDLSRSLKALGWIRVH